MTKTQTYYLEAKDTGKKQKISKESAFYYVAKNYSNPEYTLDHAGRLFNNRISLQFNYLIIKD